MDEDMDRLEKYLNAPIRKRAPRPGPQPRPLNAGVRPETGPTKSERTKSAGQNRRAQADTKNTGASRNLVDRTKDLSKLTNQGGPSEDNKAQGWDKPSLKKKRSVLKPDSARSAADPKSERKQGLAMNKLSGAADPPRPKPVLSSSPAARFGASLNSGAGSSDVANPNSPRTKPRSSQEQTNQRKGSDGVNLKAANKLTDTPPSPARPKPSGSSYRAPQDSEDQVNKAVPNRSKSGQPKPSSPVKQWGSQSQRPQKSRVPRKSNLLPPVAASSPSETETGPATSDLQKETNKKKRTAADVESAGGSGSQKMGNVQKRKKKKVVVSDEDSEDDDVAAVVKNKQGAARPVRPATGKSAGRSATTKQRSARGGRPPVKKSNLRAKDGGSPSTPGQAEDDKEEILAAAKAALDPGYAPNELFWKKSEQFFRAIADADLVFINNEIAGDNETTTGQIAAAQDPAKDKGKAEFVPPDSTANGNEILVGWQKADVAPILNQITQGADPDKTGPTAPFSICQALMSALISPEEIEAAQQSIGLDSNGMMPADLMEDWADPVEEASRSVQMENGFNMDEASTSASVPYEEMTVDERILFELHQIGIFPDIPDQVKGGQGDKSADTSSKKPDLASTSEDDPMDDDIAQLQAELAQQNSEAKALLTNAEQAARSEKESLHSEFAKRALDILVLKANERYQASKSRNASKAAKLSAQGFMKRTLDRVNQFENTGKNVFYEDEYKELFYASLSKKSDPSAYVDADITQEEKRSAGTKRKELSLDELTVNPTGPSIKRKKTDSPSSSRPRPPAKSKPKKPSKKREGLPPLYPKKHSQKEKDKEEQKEQEKEKEKEPEAGPAGGADMAGEGLPEGLDDFGGVQEVDSVGLDIPMDDLFDLF
ncbi:hypothetical protein LUZ60_003755 [Juncus effusus]|nr:hypothetical protein LUZ60_003755 [Juncus effusus]